MANYTMIWLDETQEWHMFKRDMFEIDTEQFENGYVAYLIKTNSQDIILADTWNHRNNGQKFSDVYNMLKVHDSYYLPSYIESRTREQLLALFEEHGYENIQGFRNKELKDILHRL